MASDESSSSEKYLSTKKALEEDPELTVAEACKRFNLSMSNYYFHKKKTAPVKTRKKRAPELVTMQVDESAKQEYQNANDNDKALLASRMFGQAFREFMRGF